MAKRKSLSDHGENPLIPLLQHLGDYRKTVAWPSMKHRMIWCVVVLCAFLGMGADNWAAAQTESQISSVPLMPKGVTIGMTVSELKAARPEVVAMGGPGSREHAGSGGSQALVEGSGEGELRSATTYAIQGGLLRSISAVHRYPLASYGGEREKLVQECLSALGPNPERYVRCVKVRDFDYLALVLVWTTKDGVIAVSLMPTFSEVTPHYGEVQVWAMPDMSLLSRIMSRYEPDKHPTLFQGLNMGGSSTQSTK
jgi:hypothetical protein